MKVKVNCKYCKSHTWCTNKKVKRLLWGIGARMCPIPNGDTCEYQDNTPGPRVKPAPQPGNSFITALREDWGREDVWTLD